MVNVPPIPPLLCSTPPPIDFSEDDEDMDVMPPTLEGVDDDDFGDFLTVDEKKNDEPLPSPRSPSICDLPTVSIYDGLVSPEDEEDTTTSPPPIMDDRIDRENKSIPKPIHITEAFNYNIKNTCDINKKSTTDEHKDSNSVETNKSLEVELQNEVESQSYHSKPDSQQESLVKTQNSGSTSFNKNINDLTIQTKNEESRGESNRSNITNTSCMEHMVSIEDIEDDLSDDELYSPKTPKNFIETDNLSDYFTIQEINSKIEKITQDDLKALDNNESASCENVNVSNNKYCPSNTFSTQNLYDMPPPLNEDSNQLDDDDDFGDFADFQDFSTAITAPETQHFVNNTVPVEDVNNKEPSNKDLEYNDGFNDFTVYNKTKESIHVNNNKVDASQKDFNSFRNSADVNDNDEFDEFTSHSNATTLEQITLDTETTTQEISNDNFGDFTSVAKENINEIKESFNENESFGDFSAAPLAAGHSYAKSTESLTESIRDDKELNVVALDSSEKSHNISQDNISNSNVDEEFGDFADFESHQEIPKPTENITNSISANQPLVKETFEKETEHSENEDDDDFGDFNTAQPITPTASSLTLSKTSHNSIAAPPTTTQPSHNLNERISKILYLMFSTPLNDAYKDESQPQSNKIQDIPFTSVDTAKALEYQWLNSDTRHSFIKSLGIDSRNILFGENWNPSLPRFAANLSFNPLKPMKPIQSGNTALDTTPTFQSSTISLSESTKALDAAGSSNKETLDLNSKAFNMTEQTSEASKDNNSTKLPYVSNDPPSSVEPSQLTIFENPLENEATFSKTPPISEMESVSTFSSPSPSNALDIETTTTPIASNVTNFDLKEIEENLQNVLNVNEVVVTSTFTGSFKETHIYTPSKTNDFDTKQITTATASTTSLSSPSKASPIDFDYEKAAMGVIIDETVVKKEYRDVEYNPPFSMECLSKPNTIKMEVFDANAYANNANVLHNSNDIQMVVGANEVEEEDGEVNDECSDDFTEFQSVTNEIAVPKPMMNEVAATKTNYTSVAHGGMILSPAILIPQAISMENQKPKIEWGDSAATINPEELARIEELFPEPKSLKSSNASNSSQKSTPTHQVASTPSISATIAHKELEGDDDDWSDFVSVSVTNNTSTHRGTTSNNNILTKSPAGSPFKQRSPLVSHRMPPSTASQHNNSNNDDEWSDFVSSAPPPSQPAPSSYRIPQFNSGAWQNANFYNNPLSMYHKGPLNLPTTATKSLYNNNNNYSNIPQQPYQIANNLPPVNQQMTNNVYHQQHQQQHQHQQIHVMQNFSTAPVPTPERLSAVAAAARNNQFQVGSAKVAPSIALIPDLGFVAPAIPTHTSFINSLPKPSISTKK